jgi:DNA-binding LacI/PurR family transcriptional regulator
VPPPNHKSRRAINHLRGKIVSGEWSSGMQLPTRSQLETELGVSRVTLQRVMDQLVLDGFINANGRAGTFVSDHPPHLHRYALLLPFSRTTAHSRFWDALARQAQLLNAAGRSHSLSVYANVWPRHRDPEEFDDLVAQVRAHRVAGLIFASAVHGLTDTPLVTEPDMPRVMIASGPGHTDLPVVSFDHAAWIHRACQRLRATGRRRIAVFGERAEHLSPVLQQAVQEHDLHIPPQWRLFLSHHSPVGIRHCAHLLMTLPAGQRPDGLIITDDHLVDPVAMGLADAHARVGSDVEVVAHVNYPHPPAGSSSMIRLGFDVRETLGRCLGVIHAERRGEPPPAKVVVPPRFENELLAADPARGASWPGPTADAEPFEAEEAASGP